VLVSNCWIIVIEGEAWKVGLGDTQVWREHRAGQTSLLRAGDFLKKPCIT